MRVVAVEVVLLGAPVFDRPGLVLDLDLDLERDSSAVGPLGEDVRATVPAGGGVLQGPLLLHPGLRRLLPRPAVIIALAWRFWTDTPSLWPAPSARWKKWSRFDPPRVEMDGSAHSGTGHRQRVLAVSLSSSACPRPMYRGSPGSGPPPRLGRSPRRGTPGPSLCGAGQTP